MTNNIKRVALAYSGGLDTSIIIPWLKEKIDALVAAHPEIAAPVFQNLKHAVVEQAIFHGVAGEAAILEARQAAVIRADPENSLGVFVKRPEVIARQSVLFGVGGEPSVSGARKPAPRSEPEIAGAVFQNCLYIIACQTIRRRIASVAAAFVFDQTFVRAEPKTPCPVLMNGPDSFIKKTIGVRIYAPPVQVAWITTRQNSRVEAK